jgi:hypothetical protein
MKTVVTSEQVTLTFNPNDLQDVERAKKYMEGFFDGKAPIQIKEPVCASCEYEERYGIELQVNHFPAPGCKKRFPQTG